MWIFRPEFPILEMCMCIHMSVHHMCVWGHRCAGMTLLVPPVCHPSFLDFHSNRLCPAAFLLEGYFPIYFAATQMFLRPKNLLYNNPVFNRLQPQPAGFVGSSSWGFPTMLRSKKTAPNFCQCSETQSLVCSVKPSHLQRSISHTLPADEMVLNLLWKNCPREEIDSASDIQPMESQNHWGWKRCFQKTIKSIEALSTECHILELLQGWTLQHLTTFSMKKFLLKILGQSQWDLESIIVPGTCELWKWKLHWLDWKLFWRQLK